MCNHVELYRSTVGEGARAMTRPWVKFRGASAATVVLSVHFRQMACGGLQFFVQIPLYASVLRLCSGVSDWNEEVAIAVMQHPLPFYLAWGAPHPTLFYEAILFKRHMTFVTSYPSVIFRSIRLWALVTIILCTFCPIKIIRLEEIYGSDQHKSQIAWTRFGWVSFFEVWRSWRVRTNILKMFWM